MRNADYAVSPSIILEVPITMTDNEDPPHFKRLQPDTKRMTVHLKSGAERNKFFDEVEKEWNHTYNKFFVNMNLKPEQKEEK